MSSTPTFDQAVAAFQRGDIEQARKLAEAAERSEPSAPLHHLLGLIDCRMGRLDGGIEWLRKASEAEPSNVGFRVMLARALSDAGQHGEAFDVATEPRGTSPAELALWHARGEAALAADEPEHAANAWRVLSQARPDDWRAWANQGQALARLDRWDEAASAFKRAATLNPADHELGRNLLSALSKSGDFEEAAAALEQLLEASGDDLLSRLSLARLLADLGRDSESLAQLDKAARLSLGDGAARADHRMIAIALGPDDPGRGSLSDDQSKAVRELALLLERTNRTDELKGLLDDAHARDVPEKQVAYPAAALALREGEVAEARRLLALEKPDADPVRRFRLLARIEEAAGNPEAAFAASESMNAATRDYEGWIERGARLRSGLRQFARQLTPEWARRVSTATPGSRRSPAFLVGFPRSGTTLLDTFLMGHPDTAVLEELHMLRAAESVLGPIADAPRWTQRDLERARAAYFEDLDQHVGPGFNGLAVDKLPLNMVALPMIHALFPDARIIFAQRHPCDCVLSGFMQSFALNDAMACFLTIEGAADLYDSAMTVFTRSSEIFRSPVHYLVYEQLVATPEQTLRPLVDFLGLDWKPELLDHRKTARSRGAINTPSYDQVVRPLDKGATGKWKAYSEQMKPVLPILLPWAERLGYAD